MYKIRSVVDEARGKTHIPRTEFGFTTGKLQKKVKNLDRLLVRQDSDNRADTR